MSTWFCVTHWGFVVAEGSVEVGRVCQWGKLILHCRLGFLSQKRKTEAQITLLRIHLHTIVEDHTELKLLYHLIPVFLGTKQTFACQHRSQKRKQ